MTEFTIDRRLLKDCHLIHQSEGLAWLLHKNAEVAWLIVVPETSQTEFYQLEPQLQSRLCEQVNRLSEFIKTHFNSHKINVATIGNVVSQLHMHVIGRRTDDAYWPDVVWGQAFEKRYSPEQLASIGTHLVQYLESTKA